MPLNVINYARLKRIEASETPPQTKWEMSKATKFCVALMVVAALVLYRRWVVKRDSTNNINNI